jgi:hypothetical protein
MKVMKRKILGLLIVVLMLSTIPLAVGMNSDPEELQPGAGSKRTFVSGFIAYSRLSLGGRKITFFAISVRHGQIFGDYGMWRLQSVTIPNDFTGILQAPIILGWFQGDTGLFSR